MWFLFFCSDWLGCPFAGRCLERLAHIHTHTPSRDEPAKYWPRLLYCERSRRQLPNTDPALQTAVDQQRHLKTHLWLISLSTYNSNNPVSSMCYIYMYIYIDDRKQVQRFTHKCECVNVKVSTVCKAKTHLGLFLFRRHLASAKTFYLWQTMLCFTFFV